MSSRSILSLNSMAIEKNNAYQDRENKKLKKTTVEIGEMK
jgi:hypothetical protein